MSTPLKSGINTEHIKATVRPQDDLYRHVNGAWIDSVEIPADRSSDGAFYQLYEEAEKNVRAIIESQPVGNGSSVNEKIGNLYASFMDQKSVDALGLSPIHSEITQALAISNLEEFHRALGEFEAKGHGGLFYEYVTSDKTDSITNIAYLGQSGLSLPDEAYYREEEYAPIRSALVLHIEKVLTLAGIDDAAGHAARTMALEIKIAAHHWDEVRDRDAVASYNKYSFAELKELSPGFDWEAWLLSSKTPRKVLERCIVRQPSFFSGISELLKDFDSASWSSWLTWHLVSGSAAYLSTDLAQANFDFYGTTLSGTPEMRARWKRAVSLVEGSLGEAVGQIYVAQHFPEAAKVRMIELVDNLLEAYRISISGLSWMSEETKAKALEKLSKFRPKIGYPDKWRDFSALTITPDDLVGNLARIAKFNQDYEFAKIGAPVDRDEWLMTPQTVNAYYLPTGNEVVFPAAILQPPFFDLIADDAANYGGIGAVIGHEIGHGFDDQGSKYDGDGNLNNWWSESDRQEFEKRAAQLIEQFEGLHPAEAPEVHVNGALTIGENIGDLGGLTISYKAYQLSLQGKEPPVIDGLTGYQRFFFAYAQVWRQKMRPEEVRRRIATDVHSPDEFRCNQIVRNLDEFHRAFALKESDHLYLTEEKRVRIW